MNHSPTHSRAGFTLIELALAALLVGVGLIALITLGRNSVRAALEVEDELRTTALAEDLFATLRAASTEVFQFEGYDRCLEFWSLVTNTTEEAREELRVLLTEVAEQNGPLDGEPLLLHPTLSNAVESVSGFSFPFFQTAVDDLSGKKEELGFRPMRPGGTEWDTLWDTRYRIKIELFNFWNPALPPDTVAVTLQIRPRTTHLKLEDSRQTHMYTSFHTYVPLEPLRGSLISGGLQ